MIFELFTLFLFIFGAFLCLDLRPSEFIEDLSNAITAEKEKSMKKKVSEISKKKKEKTFFKLIQEVKQVLEYTDQEEQFSKVCIASVFLGFAGVILSLTIDNIFMVPALSIALALTPFLYMKFKGIAMKQRMNEELETALSIITTSYLRSEDIVQAVDENLEHIKMPVKRTFAYFLAQTKYIDADIKLALLNIRGNIDSPVYQEWIDELIACQNDRNLKITLPPIVEKFSDMRIVSAELEQMMYSPLKEFISLVLFLVGIVPGFYFIYKDLFFVLVGTGVGKLVLAICIFIILFAVSGVIKISKPIEYKR